MLSARKGSEQLAPIERPRLAEPSAKKEVKYKMPKLAPNMNKDLDSSEPKIGVSTKATTLKNSPKSSPKGKPNVTPAKQP
jgi:hypothetical protein